MKRYLLFIPIFASGCVSGIDNDIVCWAPSGFYKGIPTISYANDQSDSCHVPTQPIFNDAIFRAYDITGVSPSHAYTYDAFPEQLSVNQLADYFAGSPPQELFSKSNLSLLMSDAFVDYLKQFSEYEGYIEHFHEKFHKSSAVKQYFRKTIGRRLCQLHREIKADKKLKQAKKRAAAQKEHDEKIKDHLFKNEHIILERYSTVEIIKKFDPDIDIALTWERLCENTYVDSDLEFLKHEYLESLLMGKCEVEYFEAHDLVNCIFDWFQNVKE